jgi:group I intron endonuclease
MENYTKGIDGRYHYVYRITNTINGKRYIGKHTTDNINDDYKGTGKIIKLALRKHGPENFTKDYLSFHNTDQDAYIEEANVIIQENALNRPDYYNLFGGVGIGGCSDETRQRMSDARKGKHTYKDSSGNTFHLSTNDPLVLSGDVVSTKLGVLMSQKFKDTISKVTSGENNGMYGKSHSEDTRKLMSTNRVGKYLGIEKTDAHKENISKARQGIIPWHKTVYYEGEKYKAKDLALKLNVRIKDLKELLNL